MANFLEDGSERGPLDHAHEARPCRLTDLATLTGEAPEGFIEAADKYLSDFAAPIHDDREGKPMLCLHCGEPLTGLMATLLGRGGFTWGLTHGEGHCAGCGWPARAIHYPKDENGDELFSLRNFVLQYLPDADAEAAARAEMRAA